MGTSTPAVRGIRRSILDLAPLELDCMNVLWRLGEATVRDVHAAMAITRPRAYTTIMTILDRLAQKGVVGRKKAGRAWLYTPNLSAEQARTRAVALLVEGFFQGSTEALASHVMNLSRTRAEIPSQGSVGTEGQKWRIDGRDLEIAVNKNALQNFRIRDLEVAPATVLAPMAGVTDTIFRRMIRSLGGCGLIMTEFTSAEGVTRNAARTLHYLYFDPDEHPITAQLFGANARVMADAAKLVEDLGFDIVDINLGCPAKKVVKCGGSGLLRDLQGLKELMLMVRARGSDSADDQDACGLGRKEHRRGGGSPYRGRDRRGGHCRTPEDARPGL